MPGYESGDWEQLKIDMIRKWGAVEPGTRYRISSINTLFERKQQGGGISNITQYKKFIGEYESMIKFLRRYEYIEEEVNHNQEILDSLSLEVQGSIYRAMIKDEVMVQARDGGYIIPKLKALKEYIEQDLKAKVLIQGKQFSKQEFNIKPKDKARFEEDTLEEVLQQVKELSKQIHTPSKAQPQRDIFKEKEPLKEVLEKLKGITESYKPQKQSYQPFNQNYKQRDSIPPVSSSHIPYQPAQLFPRPPMRCHYCFENTHTLERCSCFNEVMEKIIVRKQGNSVLFPNLQ
ncbi:hypothetical protein O181_123901 [Austropuccinia psidii MF-1]|uniref:Uncharacterized protein n=1 Tax=Austropuccinia psidii MF-1 TaxID=1389203 RepID=A0A9Q3KQ44_9BASI|nr:hypothetical protein [Austropuccinia psidii MF-1]